MASTRPIDYLHLVDDAAVRPELLAFADHGALDRMRPTVGTLGPSGPMHEALRGRGVPTFALGMRSRREAPC